jgi:hypothetical protein
MDHYIRTAYGDSSLTYKRMLEKFHGIGQGNGAGPMIWVMTSTPILQRMKARGYGVPICHPDSNKTVVVSAYAFVDDVDIIHHITNSFSPWQEVQAVMDNWTSGLHSTGGAVVGKKNNWYLLIHHWHDNQWSLLTKEKTPGEITTTGASGTSETLSRLDCNESVMSALLDLWKTKYNIYEIEHLHGPTR